MQFIFQLIEGLLKWVFEYPVTDYSPKEWEPPGRPGKHPSEEPELKGKRLRNRRRKHSRELRHNLWYETHYTQKELTASYVKDTAWRIGHHAGRLFALREHTYKG